MATSFTFAAFAARMSFRKKQILRLGIDNVTKAVGRALQVAVFATRVDTGRARGGWIITLGEVPTTLPDTPTDKAGGSTVLKGEQELSRFKRTGEKIISLSNNVEYIIFLDQGSATGPADNMIAMAVQAALAFLREAKYIGA